ncbi:GNAT family N-acetyltransferase [Geodermatophilus sp. SYSU D01176]
MTEADVDAVVAFSLDAWAPVFAGFEAVMGSRVYRLVYPDWRTAQAAAATQLCRSAEIGAWVADVEGAPVGFVAVRWTEEDATPVGEVEVVAVAPDHRGAGIAGRLLERAVTGMRARGVPLAVIGTGGEGSYAPARALYERHRFTALPLVRYHRDAGMPATVNAWLS